LWMNRIRSYYDKMLIFAEIAIMSAISPVAVLLIAFLNPNYGTLMLEALILLMPVALYIIPMIYMSSVKPRMATMPKFIPKLWILAAALGAAVAASYLLPGNIGAKIVTFIIVVLAILLPYELKWSHGIKKMEDGILRWLETAMHYMLAGSMPLDAIKKAHNMIKEPETRRLINRLNYSLESGGTTVKGPTPFSTHMLHLVGTGIRTGSLSPELMYLNVNIMYKLRNTIDESKRSVYPAIMLGIMTPVLVLLTIGVGIWFANTIALLSPEASPVPVPLPFLAINVDEILPFLYTFAVVLSLTIGAIVSTTHSNYFYSSLVHVPILLSLLIALLLGVDYFVMLFQEFLGITI
ncbi:MAG: type II secretion system F family protein, partial [Desulfurococcales archaeon]|nr:type II secretion system F family protein [Desulfurococcales archaeon]